PPTAFRHPPLLNASGIHEPFALRSIIEVESDNGYIGLGESYGDAPALAIQQQVQNQLIGLDPFNLNQLRSIVQATVAAHKPASLAGAERAS
ncbi:mandelate racemase/muconate lactonizing enzyme family protein, partial [Pseudomonas syringae pv. japonica str. M301072]